MSGVPVSRNACQAASSSGWRWCGRWCIDLLLADEPTGNLDEATSGQVLDLLLRLHQQLGTTMLLVTHSLEVARQAQRVLRLEAGRLREVSL